MNKKAQITIFIIIALLIVLLTGIGLYIYSTLEEKILVPEIQTVAEGAKPISNYVSSCLKTVTEDALNILGGQGGFIDVSQFETDNLNPTKAEAVQMSSDGEAVVPYWHYLSSENDCEKKNNCLFTSRIPSRKQVQKELEKFIEENIDDCLRNFKSIQNFKVESKGGKEARVYITEKDVQTILKYPLRITTLTENKEFKAEEFLAKVNLNLGKILDLAADLTKLQQEHSYLESQALNLLSIYSDIDTTKLPPWGKTQLAFKGNIWMKTLVKEKIKQEMLAPNLQLLRVGFFDLESDESKIQAIQLDKQLGEVDSATVDAILNRGMIVPLEKDYTSLHTTFSYLPWWDIYFDLNCDDEVCGPQKASMNYIAIFGIQRYQFAYDLSYPVLIEITDPFAIENRGYVFRFFLESNVRNNEKLRADTEVMVPIEVEDRRTMLCDLPTSGEYIVNVVNGLQTGPEKEAPINGAIVNFICGVEKCDLGELNNGVMKTKLPRCFNGRLEIAKQGFHPTVIDLNTFTDQKHYLNLKLEPYRTVEVEMKVYSLNKISEEGPWIFNSQKTSLNPKEEVTIMVNKYIKSGEQGHASIADLIGNKQTITNPCDDDPKKEINTLQLVPGDYEVSLMVISYDNLTIPDEKREEPTFWGLSSIDYTVPGMKFNCDNPFPIGQIIFKWHVEAKDLDRNEKVEFYGIVADFINIPEEWKKLEDLSKTSEAQTFADMYKNALTPVWKKQ